MIDDIKSHLIATSQAELVKLNNRLEQTRFPDAETNRGWEQGPPLRWMETLRDYWISEYDWHRTEKRINSLNSNLAKIGDDHIHFLHVQSKHNTATPIILTHGWPGSILEFLDVADRLSNPTKFGGSPDEAFHVVIPSLPGFGFSQPITKDWSVKETAAAWSSLMAALGYDAYLAQGGDWGAAVTIALSQLDPSHCLGIHLNALWIHPAHYQLPGMTPAEIEQRARLTNFVLSQTNYASMQQSRPQKIGYALADSPIALAAWILDIFEEGVEHDGSLEIPVSMDQLIDGVMMYWLPNAGATSARFYSKNYRPLDYSNVEIPAGFSRFPGEIFSLSRRLTEKRLTNLVYWAEAKAGGHFAALEEPELFANEVTNFAQMIE